MYAYTFLRLTIFERPIDVRTPTSEPKTPRRGTKVKGFDVLTRYALKSYKKHVVAQKPS